MRLLCEANLKSCFVGWPVIAMAPWPVIRLSDLILCDCSQSSPPIPGVRGGPGSGRGLRPPVGTIEQGPGGSTPTTGTASRAQEQAEGPGVSTPTAPPSSVFGPM